MPAMPWAAHLKLVGAIALAAGFGASFMAADGLRRFGLAYVTSFAFLLSLSLGGLFFVMLQHLTLSGWSVAIRRPAEILAGNLPVLAVLFVPVLIMVWAGTGEPYPWACSQAGGGSAHAGASAVAHAASSGSSGAAAHDSPAPALDELALHKRPYLNAVLFTARWVVYFAVWIGLAAFFWRNSIRQDESGDRGLTRRMQRVSAPGMVAFGFTVTFAAFDLLMSLDPHWFSTIFGVYFYAGSAVGFFATIILMLMWLQRAGLLARSVTVEHYHDLGKLLFGFVFFWGYIAFSQYMLIWYASLPETTGWFARRGLAAGHPNAWTVIAVLLLFGHFLLPFAGLLSRHVKRHRAGLALWAAWLLVMHWLDLYWLVMPELTPAGLPLGPVELGCLIGLGALYLAGLARRAGGCSLVPVRDPRLPESLAFQNP